MSFQPVLVGSGYAGWQFLQRTLAKQEESFDNSTQVRRDTDYFAANIGKVTTADQLLSDRRLLTVALGAFGLSDQVNSTALIRKVLSQGSASDTALANKLSDKRWLALTQAFGFGDGGTPATQTEGFAARIVSAYQSQQFRSAVGKEDAGMGQALEMQSAIPGLAASPASEAAKWYTVLGTRSMRSMMQTALGLPATIVSVNIDQQVKIFQDRAEQVFGDSSVSQFSDPVAMDKLVRLFLVRGQLESGLSLGNPASSGSAAVQLLAGSGAGSSGTASGILSLFT